MIRILITDTENGKVLADETAEAVIGGTIRKEELVSNNEKLAVEGSNFAFGKATPAALTNVANNAIKAVEERYGKKRNTTSDHIENLLGKLKSLLAEVN